MKDISVTRYSGYLDSFTTEKISGWAVDNGKPSAAVELEFHIAGKPAGRSLCNRCRPDLEKAGYGKGNHGFEHIFDPPLTQLPQADFRIHIAGTDFSVKHSCTPGPFRHGFEFIATDVVNNCNLRCPFCLYDYSRVKHTEKMSKETFARLLELVPYVDEGQFLVSCLHEPTLHPEFIELLEMIPEPLRRKAIFTTNNCKKMPDEYFERLAATGLKYVNVSFDSLDPARFSELRPGGKLETFLENTGSMARAFRRGRRAPGLRFIIMAFKSNMEEIPAIIRKCLDEFGAGEVEVRYTYLVPHIPEDFRAKHFLGRDDWRVLEKKLSGLPGNVLVYPPPADYGPVPPVDYHLPDDQAGFPAPMEPPPLPLKLRVSYDGTVMVIGREKYFHLNIHAARDPYATLISL